MALAIPATEINREGGAPLGEILLMLVLGPLCAAWLVAGFAVTIWAAALLVALLGAVRRP
jgi:type IV secretory pathway TrbD component